MNNEERFVSRDKLLEYVTEMLYDRCNDTNLIKYLNLRFSDKGLSVKIPSLLMDKDEVTNVYNISNLELITLIDSLHDFTKDERLNPNYYFSDLELDNYDNYIHQEVDFIDSIILKNGMKINNKQWVFYISLKDCYLYKKNMLIRYNIQTQRKSDYKIIGTKGFGIDDASLDENAVESIKEEFKKGNFTPNLITLNVLMQKGKVAQFKEESDGTIVITPNYNRDSENTTYVDCIDGYHRFTGAYKAYKEALEEGKELEGGLLVSVVRMTLEEARNYVAREFKRSSTSQEWLDVIEETDYTKAADSIIKNINSILLKSDDFVGLTYDDIKYKNKITSRSIIVDGIKNTNMQVNNISDVTYSSMEIGTIITLIIDYLGKKYFESDYKRMLNESFLLDCNMFIGYVATAYEIKQNENYERLTLKFAEELYERNKNYKEVEIELSLKNKNYTSSKIASYFKNILTDINEG